MSRTVIWYILRQSPPTKKGRYIVTDGNTVTTAIWNHFESKFESALLMPGEQLYDITHWSHHPIPPKRVR